MSINDPLLTLDIIGSGVTADNCALRHNQTTLLGRGTYDYIQGMRDELVVNRGYSLPPYYQKEWSFNKENYWTPANLGNLETWFSPEYFHPETNNPTLCVQMENQSADANAGANAVQNTTGSMATLTTTAGRHIGNTVLDFDGTTDRYLVDGSSDWSTSTDDWFCCIMLHGPPNDTDDIQHVIKKGTRLSLQLDWSGSNKDVIFNWGDGASTGSLTEVGGAQTSSTLPSIHTFGRSSGRMFLRTLKGDGTLLEQTTTRFAGSMNQTYKPRIGYNSPIGTAKHYDGEFVELIFCNDTLTVSTNATEANAHAVEGYLAHKYGVAKDILPTDHTYYTQPPRET